jgi:RNA polymerase sigma-70 factor (ECF subfamily)
LKGPDNHEEKLLIDAAQQDPSRFAELYELHFERVYAYIVRRVRERSAAEELTSHVFHQALLNIGKFKWRGAPFASWLFRIAANSIADRAQRLLRDKQPGSEVPPEIASDNPETNLEQIETLSRVYRLVNELPWDQRYVVRLRFAEERSIRDVAQKLCRSEGAVKQLQFRALQNLRARMSEKNG